MLREGDKDGLWSVMASGLMSVILVVNALNFTDCSPQFSHAV